MKVLIIALVILLLIMGIAIVYVAGKPDAPSGGPVDQTPGPDGTPVEEPGWQMPTLDDIADTIYPTYDDSYSNDQYQLPEGVKPEDLAPCPPDWETDPESEFMCRRPKYMRVGGKPKTECAKGMKKIAGLCYDDCPEGFELAGGICRAKCPKDWASTLSHCTKPFYTRPATSILETGQCPNGYPNEKPGGLCYEKCREGYAEDPTGGFCVANCPDGFEDTGGHCTKPYITRTGTSIMNDDVGGCPSDYPVFIAGRCYKECKPGYERAGVTCYAKCSA